MGGAFTLEKGCAKSDKTVKLFYQSEFSYRTFTQATKRKENKPEHFHSRPEEPEAVELCLATGGQQRKNIWFHIGPNAVLTV